MNTKSKLVIASLAAAGVFGFAISSSSAQHRGHGPHGGDRGQEMFERLDADGDGVVTEAEFFAFEPPHLQSIDLDGDGDITEAEAENARYLHAQEFATRLFERGDEDGDGVILVEDLNARHAERIAEVDADGDGQITMDEVEAAALARADERPDDRFARHDTDGDGVVSGSERDAHRAEMFARMDIDGDGGVTFEEAREAHQAMRAERGGRFGGGHGDRAPQRGGRLF